MAFPLQKIGPGWWRASTTAQRDMIGSRESLAVGDRAFVDADGLTYKVDSVDGSDSSTWSTVTSGSGGGWQTVLDVDYTAITPLSLNINSSTALSDGNTIHLTSGFTTAEIVAGGMHLVVAAGTTSTQSARYLMTDLLPGWNVSSPTRITIQLSDALLSTILNQNFKSVGTGLFNQGTPTVAPLFAASAVRNTSLSATILHGASQTNLASDILDPKTVLMGVFNDGRAAFYTAVNDGGAGVIQSPLEAQLWFVRDQDDRSVRSLWGPAIGGGAAFSTAFAGAMDLTIQAMRIEVLG